jgi:undecaprenyl-diphosphatase
MMNRRAPEEASGGSAVGRNKLTDWDRRAYLLVQGRLRASWAHRPMIVITQSGTKGAIWVAMALLLVAFGGRSGRHAAMVEIAALLVAEGTINLLLKPVIARERPYEARGPGQLDLLLVRAPGPHSWPSAHAGSSVAAGLSLAMLMPGLAAPVLILAALIAFSRVYVGVHFPLDVLAGVCVGVMSAVAALAVAGALAHAGVNPAG